MGACALFLFVAESNAKVIVKESTVYYSFSGRTGIQVYEQIGRKGPRVSGHKDRKVAITTMQIKLKDLQAAAKGNQCVVTRVDLQLNVTYRIPKWTNRNAGSPATRKAWDTFLAHIWRHEKQHAEIARDHAVQAERAVMAARGDIRKGCKDMEGSLVRALEKAKARHDRRQLAFDASWFGDGGKQWKHDRALVAAK